MTAKKTKDHGEAEVQKHEDVAEDKGFIGQEVDQVPDREYSIQSGPDSPTAVPDIHTRVEQPSATKEKS